MSIQETDISILIPTYRYRDKVVRAVRSALQSGAGEIIVSDDNSNDGTIEAVQKFSDLRLRISENPRNLGLWENHLRALRLARRPWVKFIQADDYLLPEGLVRYAQAAGHGVSLVWGAPVVEDESTGARSQFHQLRSHYRVDARMLFDACVAVGWIPGSPSHMMIKTSEIAYDPRVWRTSMSADFVVGAIAATRGDTVLMPHGAICQGRHELQDSSTQGSHMGLTRLISTLEYLRQQPHPELQRFANLFGAISLRPGLRTAARGFVFGEGSRTEFAKLASRLVLGTDWVQVSSELRLMLLAHGFRRRYRRATTDLDAVFRTLRSEPWNGDG
ncbi:MAG: glycosyltransferase [Myxococcota bacterium]